MPMAERPGSWNSNVWYGWLDLEVCYPVTLMRYEDLHSHPLEAFTHLAAPAAGIQAPEDKIARSVASTRFERLQSEERAHGFRERHPASSAFFRSGRPQAWKGILDDTLRERLASCCAPAMGRLGYSAD